MTVDDLYSVDNCPIGERCESCGSGGVWAVELTAASAETPLGVLCFTLCRRCVESEQLPRLSAAGAVRFVAAHAGHLGITVDEMADVLAGEQR